MNAANTTVILFTPLHLTNNFLLFFSRLCFLRFCIWLPHKPESLFTESDTVTAVANTPITMLHIGQTILVYYTTNHLISQSKKRSNNRTHIYLHLHHTLIISSTLFSFATKFQILLSSHQYFSIY